MPSNPKPMMENTRSATNVTTKLPNMRQYHFLETIVALRTCATLINLIARSEGYLVLIMPILNGC